MRKLIMISILAAGASCAEEFTPQEQEALVREPAGIWTTTFPRWDADGTFTCCVVDCYASEPDSPPCPCTYGIGECTCLLMSEGYGYWDYLECREPGNAAE